ncbi:MAG: tetratricopeptide repeat protein [Betaproteobacteria bacterium]|nr:MAG: tetratricopeptide repeat protein [Betaproteobacteria bacterium]
MVETKRRLTAILAADVAGYSRLMAADEHATLVSLNACRDIFREEVASHGGRIVDTAGDSVLAYFDSVVEAVKSAVAVQSKIDKRNEGLPRDKRMAFRIGVNLGDVIEQEDGTIYGDGVNIAARLEALAEPGGVMVSDDAFRQVRKRLDVGFEDAGEHEIKNIPEPVRTHRVLLGTTSTGRDPEAASLALPDKPSIAVLPFDNLSGDPGQEYFADGVAEDIITGLSHDRALFVIARNSTFTYKGKPVNVVQVGRELGVRYVIEGSVRKAGSRVRISAQLIDATSGNHLWADHYDRELEDIFAVQDDITSSVTATVAPELMAAEMDRSRRKSPANLDSWDFYLRAIWFIHKHTLQSFAEALPLAEEAIRLDPDSALGFTAFAWCRLSQATFGPVRSRDESLVAGLDAATRAVTLDPGNPMAHGLLGQADTQLRKYSEASRWLKRAIELAPNFALGWGWLGLIYACTGEREQAVYAIEEALRLSPRDPLAATWFSITGLAEFNAEHYDAAIDCARRGQERNPNHPGIWRVLAASYGQAGRLEEAGAAVAQLRRVAPDITIESTRAQLPWSDAAVAERYLDGLRKGRLPET